MATLRNIPVLGVFIVLVCLQTVANAASVVTTVNGANSTGYLVVGRVKVDGMGEKVFRSKTANIQVIWNGGQQKTFVRPDGYFAFYGVRAGTHLMEVFASGYYFSPVRVDVSARLHGRVTAVALETQIYYSDELILKPTRKAVYHEQRGPLKSRFTRELKITLYSTVSKNDCITLVLLGFQIIIGKMVDPEELKKMQEGMQNQPGASPVSRVLQGGKSSPVSRLLQGSKERKDRRSLKAR